LETTQNEPQVTDENKSSMKVNKGGQKENPEVLQKDNTMRSHKPRKLRQSMVETLEQEDVISTTSDEECVTYDDAEQVKNIHDQEDTWPRKDNAHTLRSIPARAGGPYLCDSDSDVTVPITMVESLEMVEDSED
jgi:hypothetical protein